MRWYKGNSSIHGNGAFAGEEIPENNAVDYLVSGLAGGGLLGVDRTKLGELINHQADPNGRMEIVPGTPDKYYLRSLKNIHPGSEITMDYNDSPPFVARPHEIDPEGYQNWK